VSGTLAACLMHVTGPHREQAGGLKIGGIGWVGRLATWPKDGVPSLQLTAYR
jgi:hypothetical protein